MKRQYNFKTGDLVKIIEKGSWMVDGKRSVKTLVGVYIGNRTGDPKLFKMLTPEKKYEDKIGPEYHEVLVNGSSHVYDVDFFWDLEPIST